MRTDTELLDWLSGEAKRTQVSAKYHYNGMIHERTPLEQRTGGLNGNIDFFTCHSQHIQNVKDLRTAINMAMDMKRVA